MNESAPVIDNKLYLSTVNVVAEVQVIIRESTVHPINLKVVAISPFLFNITFEIAPVGAVSNVILIVVVFEPSMFSILLGISISSWMGMSRQVRP